MSWAGGRRFLIVAIGAVVIIAAIAFTLIATFYQAPSCSDKTQNQNEAGIDCGGPCPYLCTATEQAPVVRFTQALSPTAGRVDVIAYIDNPNRDASARSAPYQVTLYNADHTILKTGGGVIDLPAGSTVPIFIPAFFTGTVTGVQAFITFDQNKLKWFTPTQQIVIPTVTNPTLTGTALLPRVTATLSNPSNTALSNIPVVVALFDSSGNVIAASQTLVLSIRALGSAAATFTWNAPFSGTPTRIEVAPLISL